jgi:hypothetical protein
MTRRSALAAAGGVVAALGAGIVATIVNVGVLNASEAQGPGQLRAKKPVVRTITQTETIHKKANDLPATSDSVIVRSRPGTSMTPQSTTGARSAYDDDSYNDDDAYEDESDDHDAYEAEEHEFDESDDD